MTATVAASAASSSPEDPLRLQGLACKHGWMDGWMDGPIYTQICTTGILYTPGLPHTDKTHKKARETNRGVCIHVCMHKVTNVYLHKCMYAKTQICK